VRRLAARLSCYVFVALTRRAHFIPLRSGYEQSKAGKAARFCLIAAGFDEAEMRFISPGECPLQLWVTLHQIGQLLQVGSIHVAHQHVTKSILRPGLKVK
jgi:hypothetical protein